jgi:hypothetical protein
MTRAREIDPTLSPVAVTPRRDDPAGLTPPVEPRPAPMPSKRPLVRDALDARMRDIRNPHRRRWRPES